MLAALQERTPYRPTTDIALMKWIVRHAAWLISRFTGNDVQSPVHRAMEGPCRGTLLEVRRICACSPSRGGWLGNSDLTHEHLVRTDERVVCARSVRRIAEHSWSEENLRAIVETPQRLKTTIAEIPPAAEPLALPHEPPEAAGDAKEEPTGEQEEDDEMQGGQWAREKHLERRPQAEARNAQRHKRMCP